MTTEKKASISRYGHHVVSSDGFKLPVGTTEERSSAPIKGFLRLNDSTKKIEFFLDFWLSLRNDVKFTAVKAANFNAERDTAYPVNSSSSTVTVTTPVNPKSGDRFVLFDSEGTWDTRSVIVAAAVGSKIERVNDIRLNVKDDHVVYVYTGIPSLGWVRENGGYPLGPVYNSIDLKADKTYVNNLYSEKSHADIVVPGQVETTLLQFNSNTNGFKVLLHVVKADGNVEMFDLLATKSNANVAAFTICGEVVTGATGVTFDVSYDNGLKLTLTSDQEATVSIKVIWNAIR